MEELTIEYVNERIDMLREDMSWQWELTCSIFRTLQDLIAVLTEDRDGTMNAVQVLNRQMQYTRNPTDKKRLKKYG